MLRNTLLKNDTFPMAHGPKEELILGDSYLSIKDIIAGASSNHFVSLSTREAWHQQMDASVAFLERQLANEQGIYGVTTGYGKACDVAIPNHLLEELPIQLTRFHGCGLGAFFSPEIARAVMLVRCNSLAQGVSGVRISLLQQICDLLNRGITPLIPEEGSVGASGDLTPLSYLAAVLMGEREVKYLGEICLTKDVFDELKISPLRLKPKEGLALMNGTSVMTALACFAYHRAEYLLKLSSRITALVAQALLSNISQFDSRLFSFKPFPGQMQIAKWISQDLSGLTSNPAQSTRPEYLQDRYSIRCAPHVLGVLADALPWMKETIEIEINSANDNPLIDAEKGKIFHGGHFYGGHIAFAMDSMKNAVSNIADLLDRQLALLVDCSSNRGLPANISGALGDRAVINHGFKAVQIATSAWTAEALKLSIPASVFSRSTESHNQDKVSMGTIAARDSLRVLELTEQVAAAVLLAGAQGIWLRERSNELKLDQINPKIKSMLSSIEDDFLFLDQDRPLDLTLRKTCQKIKEQHWNLYQTEY